MKPYKQYLEIYPQICLASPEVTFAREVAFQFSCTSQDTKYLMKTQSQKTTEEFPKYKLPSSKQRRAYQLHYREMHKCGRSTFIVPKRQQAPYLGIGSHQKKRLEYHSLPEINQLWEIC